MDTLKNGRWQKELKVLHLAGFKSVKACRTRLNPDWFSLIIVLSGTIYFMDGTSTVSLYRGDMYAVPRTAEVIKLTSSVRVCFMSCKRDFAITNRFSRSGIGYIEVLAGYLPSVISLTQTEMSYLIQVFGFLKKKISSRDSIFQEEMVLLYVNLILYEFSALCYKHSENITAVHYRREKIVMGFMTLVRQHCRVHHEVSFYANSLYISRGYLGKAVRQIIGMPLKQYIEMAIVSEAYVLLEDKTLAINKIGEHLNFRNPQSFSNFFKKHTKLTPTQYRHNLKF
ncbi:helix-turn-helix domain-containing protein [Flavobacterium cupreum]|uniref:Helix-turn-helix domain-containing protein n=1 Tax=Flavobacterium cupreum TaxID=2133766 RepID=A0A434A7D3_9FLAO|nr:helix-turn-helix domain-containing protein [Flavobacterium cupreum]RUT70256.1 helix-turn-helix domain-containing protein [Flavobacterium cupreum]